VDMVLVDWTRMGRTYCLAGAVLEGEQWRMVRPLLTKFREAVVRNVGWSAYLMDGHARWEILELIGPQPTDAEPPHLEDLWVRAMRSRRSFASPAQRRAILAATMVGPKESLFGVNLASMRTAAYVPTGAGTRSLATLKVSTNRLRFDAVWREGRVEPDIRVEVPLPDLGNRWLPVKDHHLLIRGERAGNDLERRVKTFHAAVQLMGEQVAVRLGLSRSFQGQGDQPGVCWLMADGFFSLADPQS
jgi:hypothetical protein